MALPSASESLTSVTFIQHPLQAVAAERRVFALDALVARDVGAAAAAQLQADAVMAAGAAAEDRERQAAQLLYWVEWQAEAAAGASATPCKQPLLAAELASGRRAAVVSASGDCVAAAAAKLLRGLQLGAVNGLANATTWQLGSAAPAAARSAAAPAINATAAASLHALLKVAAAERLIAAGTAVVFDSSSPSRADASNRHFGAARHSATRFSPLLLPCCFAARASAGSDAAASGGAVLVTGGLGGLGLLTAAWLEQRQQPQQPMFLLGRTGFSSVSLTADTACSCLTASACEVSMARCDVAAACEAQAVVAMAARRHLVHAVLHVGGLLADAMLVNQTAASVRAVAAPKLNGLVLLAAAAAEQPLQQLLLYSSIAGELGTVGQANYAAANAALDAAAGALQQQGRGSTSLQWGAWAGAGMATVQPQLLARLQRQGYGAVLPEEGLSTLQLVLSGGAGAAALMAAPFDWRRFLSGGARHRLPFFAAAKATHPEAPALAERRRTAAHPPGAMGPGTPTKQAVTAETVLPVLQQLLADMADEGDTAGPPSAAAAHVPFLEAGLDSIGAVELRWARLSQLALLLPSFPRCQRSPTMPSADRASLGCPLSPGTACPLVLGWTCPPHLCSATPRPPAWRPTWQQS